MLHAGPCGGPGAPLPRAPAPGTGQGPGARGQPAGAAGDAVEKILFLCIFLIIIIIITWRPSLIVCTWVRSAPVIMGATLSGENGRVAPLLGVMYGVSGTLIFS